MGCSCAYSKKSLQQQQRNSKQPCESISTTIPQVVLQPAKTIFSVSFADTTAFKKYIVREDYYKKRKDYIIQKKIQPYEYYKMPVPVLDETIESTIKQRRLLYQKATRENENQQVAP